MSSDLRDLLRDAGRVTPSSEPDMETALRRGRALSLRRRFFIGGLALMLAGASTTVLMSDFSFTREASRSRGNAPASSGVFQQVEDHRVATFAVRAAAAAGLLDRGSSQTFDYENIRRNADGWTVTFDDGAMTVAVQEGWLVVVDSEGTTPEAQDKLSAYRERATEETPRFEFLFPEATSLAYDDGAKAITASVLWTGPIPFGGSRAECHLELYDEAGKTIYTGPTVPIDPPQAEAARAGGVADWGILEPVGGVASSDILCEMKTRS